MDLEAAMKGDLIGALDPLLDAWRRSRSPALAEAIELVGARVDGARERPVPGKLVSDRIARWAELATGGAEHVGELMRTLLDVPGHELEPRFAALVAREPDPRIAAGTVAAFEQTFKARGATWYHFRNGHAVIVRHGDARTLARVEALAGTVRSRNAPISRKNFWAKTARELRAVLPEPDRETERDARVLDLARAVAPRPAAPGDGPVLLRAIYDDPADDAVRQVYADFLLERGDPRGEFINLQLARARGAGTVAGRRRENELLRTWGDEWLGAIAPLIQKGGREFERGFLDGARAGTRGSTTTVEPGAGEWSTVVDLDIESFGSFFVMVTAPVRKSLRVLRGVNPHWLREDDLDLERLVLVDAAGWFARYGWRALLDAAAVSTWRVSHLEVPAFPPQPDDVAPFWQYDFTKRLSSITIHVHHPVSYSPHSSLAHALATLLAAPVPVHLIRSPRRESDWTYRLVRKPTGYDLHVELHGAPSEFLVRDLGAAIAGVSHVLDGITIANVPETTRPAIESVLAGNRVTFVDVPQ